MKQANEISGKKLSSDEEFIIKHKAKEHDNLNVIVNVLTKLFV